MKTGITEILTKLKLEVYNFQPNLNDIVNEVKMKEIDYHRTKVVSLSQAILKNPNNMFRKGELKSSLERLDDLYSA